MIRLTSNPSDKAEIRLEGFRKNLEDAMTNNCPPAESALNGYRHPDVKDSISIETRNKCAYCEGKILSLHWGDVEHIRPKDQFPDERLQYENLTLSCPKCNNNKSNYYSDEQPIINPYNDEPSDHIVALGQFFRKKNSDKKGERTILLLKLNRDGLHEKRNEQIDALEALVDKFNEESDGLIKDSLKKQIVYECSEVSEFSFSLRSYLKAAHNLDPDTL